MSKRRALRPQKSSNHVARSQNSQTGVVKPPSPSVSSVISSHITTFNEETNWAVQLLTALKEAPPPSRHICSIVQHSRPLSPPTSTSADTSTLIIADGNLTDSTAEGYGADGPGPLPRTIPSTEGLTRSNSASNLQCSQFKLPDDHRLQYKHPIPFTSSYSSPSNMLTPCTMTANSVPPSPQHFALGPAARRLEVSLGVPTQADLANPSKSKYTPEERLQAVRRFKEKKLQRSFKKKIRYDVRKRLADTRPRFKGRFSKPQSSHPPQSDTASAHAFPVA